MSYNPDVLLQLAASGSRRVKDQPLNVAGKNLGTLDQYIAGRTLNRAGHVFAVQDKIANGEVPPERWVKAPKEAQNLLQHILSHDESGYDELVAVWLQAANFNQFLPEEVFWPQILKRAERNSSIPDVLSKTPSTVLKWLADQNRQWKRFPPMQEHEWKTASDLQRFYYVKNLQKTPQEFLIFIQDNLLKLSSNEQVEVLDAVDMVPFEMENFLEELLSSKSLKVRKSAARLLVKIPSHYLSNLQEQVKEVVSVNGTFRKNVSFHYLEVNEFFKENVLFDDNVHNTYLTQYLTREVVSLVPPDFWEGSTGLPVSKIVETLSKGSKTDGSVEKSILQGFITSTFEHQNSVWAEHLLRSIATDYHSIVLTRVLSDTQLVNFFQGQPDALNIYFQRFHRYNPRETATVVGEKMQKHVLSKGRKKLAETPIAREHVAVHFNLNHLSRSEVENILSDQYPVWETRQNIVNLLGDPHGK